VSLSATLARPAGLDGALAALASEDVRPVAGGVGITLARHANGIPRGPLLAIAALAELRGVTGGEDGAGLRLGAAETLDHLAGDPRLRRAWPVAAEAIGSVATTRIRRLVTLGGNLAALDPTHDPWCGLIAAGASAELHRAGSEPARIPLEGLDRGALKGALLAAVHLPATPPRTGSAYRKYLVRGVWEYACVAVGAVVTLDPDSDTIATARVALGSVAREIVLVDAGALTGHPGDPERVDAVAEAAAAACDPWDDVRGSAAYKRRMVAVHTGRALRDAIGRAGA
jgi:carbon-monoxide dehydrogenase medium subunit